MAACQMAQSKEWSGIGQLSFVCNQVCFGKMWTCINAASCSPTYDSSIFLISAFSSHAQIMFNRLIAMWSDHTVKSLTMGHLGLGTAGWLDTGSLGHFFVCKDTNFQRNGRLSHVTLQGSRMQILFTIGWLTSQFWTLCVVVVMVMLMILAMVMVVLMILSQGHRQGVKDMDSLRMRKGFACHAHLRVPASSKRANHVDNQTNVVLGK